MGQEKCPNFGAENKRVPDVGMLYLASCNINCWFGNLLLDKDTGVWEDTKEHLPNCEEG